MSAVSSISAGMPDFAGLFASSSAGSAGASSSAGIGGDLNAVLSQATGGQASGVNAAQASTGAAASVTEMISGISTENGAANIVQSLVAMMLMDALSGNDDDKKDDDSQALLAGLLLGSASGGGSGGTNLFSQTNITQSGSFAQLAIDTYSGMAYGEGGASGSTAGGTAGAFSAIA